MSTTYIKASEITHDTTLLIDGQHHIVDDVVCDEDGEIHVEADTVIGDIGHRSFWFDSGQSVMVLRPGDRRLPTRRPITAITATPAYGDRRNP